MNIKYHIVCGVILDISFQTKGIMTVFSILPDTPLLINEISLIKNKRKFDEWDISNFTMILYKCTHSLLVLPLIYKLHTFAWFAWLVHQVCDWFTHTGRFTAMPIFPFSYKVKFGRNILK